MPTGELRIVRVGESLGDDALEVGVDDCLVKCSAFTDDAVGERDPALGAFGDLGKPGLATPNGSGRRSTPSAISRSKAT